MTELTIHVHKAHWMSSNHREHRQVVARKTAAVRDLVFLTARGANLGRFDQASIVAHVQYPTARRADPPNSWPTVKAAIDGMVDAGVFPDDDDVHVVSTEFRRDPGRSPTGTYRLRLVVTEVCNLMNTDAGGGPHGF